MKLFANFLLFLLFLLQVQLWFGSHGLGQLRALQNTIAHEKAKNDQMMVRNEQLHAEVEELKDGKDALEERARSQLGFIRDGETFYRVVPKSAM